MTACAGAQKGAASRPLEGRRVRDVTIVGNKSFGDDEIIAKLAHRPPSSVLWLFAREHTTYSPLELRVDGKRVVAFYAEHGYFNAEVVALSAKPVDEDGVSIEIRVDENAPTRVADVRVVGVPGGVGDVVRRELAKQGVAPGRVLDHADYLEGKRRAVDALVRRGFAFARLEGRVEVDRDENRAVVILDVDAGPPVRFGTVSVTGIRRMPSSLVLDRVAWKSGDRFDPKLIALTQQRLTELGVFSAVRVDYDKLSRTRKVDMIISVVEGPANEVRAGGGVGIDNIRIDGRVRGGYVGRGVVCTGWFCDRLLNLRFDARVGYLLFTNADESRNVVFQGDIGLERVDFLLTGLQVNASVGASQEIFEAFESRAFPRMSVSLSRLFFDDRLRLRLGWQFRRLEVTPDDEIIARQLVLPDNDRLGFYEASVIYDARDNSLNPRRGWFASLAGEIGTNYALGEIRYEKATVDLRGYQPLTRRIVVAARGRVGLLRSRLAEITPITQRFYGGGPFGQRGFVFRSLSPEIPDISNKLLPVGGDGLILATGELRVRLTRFRGEWLRLALFVDAADVTAEFEDLDPTDLHYAVGAGIRYDTPVGPVRLDIGVRLNRRDLVRGDGSLNPEAGGLGAFALTVGEAF